MIGFGQFRQQKADFPCSQHARYPETPAALAHQFDGIPVNQFPSPRGLIQNMLEVANVSLALRSQCQRTEPGFYRDRAHIIKQTSLGRISAISLIL